MFPEAPAGSFPWLPDGKHFVFSHRNQTGLIRNLHAPGSGLASIYLSVRPVVDDHFFLPSWAGLMVQRLRGRGA
jgi:hypothetical protein